MTRPILFVLLPLAVCVAGVASAETLPDTTVIAGFAHPEGALIGPSARYISNIGEKMEPVAKDGDGFISLVGADGEITEMKAFTGLDAPKGMTLSGTTLYVADIDRVVGFDTETRKQVFEAKMTCAEQCFLNDIVAADDRLLVTDTMHGSLLGLDPQTGTFTVLADDIPGANGVLWDADNTRAVVVSFGRELAGGALFTWSDADGLAAVADGPTGLFDGVALLSDGKVVVSDWRNMTGGPGAFLTVDLATGESQAVDLGLPIPTPADHALDAAARKLWIPATAEGTVIVAPLP